MQYQYLLYYEIKIIAGELRDRNLLQENRCLLFHHPTTSYIMYT